MKAGISRACILALAAAAAIAIGACGEEEAESTVVEGEPLELGELRFNVQLTRFLNPDDTEDAEYLRELPAPPPGEDYLAVFMDVENEGDEDAELPAAADVSVEDTTGSSAEPVETESLFALQLGETIPAGGELPEADTAASSGPVQGAFLLFLVPEAVTENRPLELQIGSHGEEGVIELDL
jgi:hypothetical protein